MAMADLDDIVLKRVVTAQSRKRESRTLLFCMAIDHLFRRGTFFCNETQRV